MCSSIFEIPKRPRPKFPHSAENRCMVDDLLRSGSSPRNPESRARTSRAAADAQDISAQIRDLERLRQWVLERLDAIEQLARGSWATSPGPSELADLERVLERKKADLEEME